MSSIDSIYPLNLLQVIGTILMLWLLSVAITTTYNVFFHPLAKFPGPLFRAAFYFPDCWSMMKGNSHIAAQALHKKYGEVVRIMPNALIFNTAQAWQDIYGTKKNKAQLEKDPMVFKEAEVTNIIVANSIDHARIRKPLSHAFSESALREQEQIMSYYFDLLITRLKENVGSPQGVDIMSWYNFTTFDIVADLALGESFGALEKGDYHIWIRNMFQSVKFLGILRFASVYTMVDLLLKLLLLAMPSMVDRRKSHFDFTRQKVEKRLNSSTDRKDFTNYVLRNNKGGEKATVSHEEIIGSTGVILIAGSETTATLLSGATYQLLKNPDILTKLQSEIRNFFKHEDEITLQALSQPGALPYMEAVIQESLRIYPPVPASLPRVTGSEGQVIDGYFVPPHTSVGVHQWATYQSESNFKDAKVFKLERWLQNPPPHYKDDNKAALQPFSLGPRNCLGKNLANFEMRSILARILWNFELSLANEDYDWLQQKSYLLWDKSPLWVRLHSRK